MRITLGYHNWGQVHARFCSSLARTVGFEGRRISEIIDIPSPYVAEARNKIVHAWLSKTKAKWLLMLDADMEFPEDAPSRAAYIAETLDLPILGGCYSLGDNGLSLFAPANREGWVRPLLSVQPGAIYRNLGGAATGFILIRRDAAEKIREENEGPWYWFDHDRYSLEGTNKDPDDFLACGFSKQGEDMSFCQRATKAGIEVAGTTHIPLIHHKFRAMVPQSLASMFEGQKVTFGENPWIKKNEELLKKEAEESKEEAE